MLILTSESIWVSDIVGGTFHSKVSLVTKGLSHISTTLDPLWQGQLLVPMCNTSYRTMKVVIGKENESGIIDYESFVTLVLYRAVSPALCKSDNKPYRYDLLYQIVRGKQGMDSDIARSIRHIQQQIDRGPKRDSYATNSEFVVEFNKFYNSLSSDIESKYNYDIANPITQMYNRNAIVVGCSTAIMLILACLIIWYGTFFSQYAAVLTVYLFGCTQFILPQLRKLLQ